MCKYMKQITVFVNWAALLLVNHIAAYLQLLRLLNRNISLLVSQQPEQSARTAIGLAILLGNAPMWPSVTTVVFLGILRQNAVRNLSAGTVWNQATWLETVETRVFATPVGRQDTVPESAQLLSYLSVT